MLGVFGGAALLLALAGIYGAIAFNVAQRTNEIGVRLALGARNQSVVGMVLRQLPFACAGIAVGLAVALGASRSLGLLYDMSPRDPVAYFAAAPRCCSLPSRPWLPARAQPVWIR